MPTLGYSSLDKILSNKNARSLFLGLVLSFLIGLIITVAVVILVHWILPGPNFFVVYAAAALLGAMFGFTAGKEFFNKGLFTVKPGQTAFISILDIPLMEMEIGDGWIIPRIMEAKIVDSQAFIVILEPERFLTGNGIEMNAQMSATARAKDPLKVQTIRGNEENVRAVIGRQLSSKTRVYITTQHVEGIDLVGDLEKLNPKEQWEFVMTVTGFKGKLVREGPEKIRVELNKALAEFGLEVPVDQVQINRLSLPDNIETAINRIFEEIFEKIGLTSDARNKAAVAAIFNEAVKNAGVDVDKLTLQERLELVRENLDRALANEDKAKIAAFHFRGRNPGMIFNTPSN